MIKYFHGSEDSTDIDVFYVFDTKPSYHECHTFCSADTVENRNIIVIKDGFVVDCFKGTVDEIQNSLLATYHLHSQEFPLIISETVKRNVMLKNVRVLRCFLSHFSRTKWRTDVKDALRSHDWKKRLDVVRVLDMETEEFGKNSNVEVRKVFAFQLAQILGLYAGIEIYTKSDAANAFPSLEPYLYRHINPPMNGLTHAYKVFIEICDNLKVNQVGDIVYFPDYNVTIDLNKEIIL